MLKNRLPRLATVTLALLLVLTAVSLLACEGEGGSGPTERPGFDRDTPTPEATAEPATEAPGAAAPTATATSPATAAAGPATEPAEEPTQPL